jgi:CubicO group peptidase (beta-lactamase class C family)
MEPVNSPNGEFSEIKLKKLEQYLSQHGSSSMMIIHKDQVVFSWGNINKKHLIHSIRKSMLNALYGVYVGKGIIDLSLTLKELGIDDIHHLTEQEKSATISDLLKSRSGVYHSATSETEEMLASKPERGSHKPNRHYYYNNWDFNAAGHIFEKLTGKKIFEAFYEDIAKPIGMTDYHGKFTKLYDPKDEVEIPQTDGFYQFESRLSNFPAYHFRLSNSDMARFAQLYLNKGKWQGKEIIPQSWIEKSTQAYSITNKQHNLGYGMLWGVVYNEDESRVNSFYHMGVGVHMMAVYPEHEMVFVHRVDTEKKYTFRNQHIYPIISMVFGAKEDVE